MLNRRMQEKLEAGEAMDVSACPRTAEGDYILESFPSNMDFCDALTEGWIWSVGRHLKTGQILASTTSKFYLNPEYDCLFLR